jgi:hypothetical protein
MTTPYASATSGTKARADELIRVAGGRNTVEKTRTTKGGSSRKTRAGKSPPRGVDPFSDQSSNGGSATLFGDIAALTAIEHQGAST